MSFYDNESQPAATDSVIEDATDALEATDVAESAESDLGERLAKREPVPHYVYYY